MLDIYEYIYPTTVGQISYKPVNTIAGTSIEVLRNGSVPETYTLNVNGNIDINTGLNLNEFLIVKTVANNFIPIGDYGDVYLKRYNNAKITLKNNQRYTADIQIEDSSVHLDFTSRYDPFYTNAKLIRTDLQDIVILTDDEINFLIWDNSYRVLVTMQGAGDVNYNLPVPYTLSDPNHIPYNIQQHVRYSVEFDILNTMYLMMTGKGGKISKKLGDMQIDKNMTVPKLSDLLQGVKDKLNQFTLQNGFIKTMVKGNSTDPWSVNPRRSF